MKQILISLTLILVTFFALTGCSSDNDNTSVETIGISLDEEQVTFDQRMVITLESSKEFDSCRYFIVKPSSSEILFAESDKCNTLIFNPRNMPPLFDEGEGTYRVKVIGQNEDRITGMGFEQFTFVSE